MRLRGSVPGESGDAVRRVRDGGGWVRKRIRGGSVTARLFCEGHIGLDEFGSGQAEVGRLMGVSHAKTNESKVASQRNRWVEEAGRKKFGMRKLGRWWTERKRGEERNTGKGRFGLLVLMVTLRFPLSTQAPLIMSQ